VDHLSALIVQEADYNGPTTAPQRGDEGVAMAAERVRPELGPGAGDQRRRKTARAGGDPRRALGILGLRLAQSRAEARRKVCAAASG